MIMPRLSFEEPKGGPLAKAAQPEDPAEETQHLSELFVEEPVDGGRHRRPTNRDIVLVVLRAATFAVAIALVGAVILLTTSGGEDEAKAPAVPQIADSREPSTGPTTTTPPVAIVAPEVRSQTTEMAPPPVTQPTVPTDQPTGPPANQFVRIGDKCDTPGAYAFTERFEPVVCDRRRGQDQLVWRRMFR
jgi:hypothetical protein